MSLLSLEEYYKLKNDPSKKEAYYEQLKILSDNTNSREYFKDDVQRKNLHKNILDKKLENQASHDIPFMHLISGSIGAGKTSTKDKFLSKDFNYVYINFDEIKKLLPEYNLLKKINPEKAAQFVQHESAILAGELFRKAARKKCHIVFEKNIVKSKRGEFQVIQDIKFAKKYKYIMSLQVVFLDTFDEVWKRVQKRAKEIKRFVPKEVVEKTFNNLFPILNEVHKDIFKDFLLIVFWYNGSEVPSSVPIYASLACTPGLLENDISLKGLLGEMFFIDMKGDTITVLDKIMIKNLSQKQSPVITALKQLDFFPKWDYIESIRKD